MKHQLLSKILAKKEHYRKNVESNIRNKFSTSCFLLVCMLTISFSTSSFGQSHIGAKGGVHFSKYSDDFETIFQEIFGESVNLDFRPFTGLQCGIVYHLSINSMISFQTEVFFIQKGILLHADNINNGGTTTAEIKQYLNYMEIPLLLNTKFSGNEKFGFFATAGPSFGIGLNGKSKSDALVSGEPEKEEQELDFQEDGLSRLDMSAALGLGVDVQVGPGKVVLETRFLLGFNSIEKDTGEYYKIKNRGLGFSLSYLLPLGSK